MPELPEVETTRLGLVPRIVGRRIHEVVVREPRLRWPVPRDLASRLRGTVVQAIGRSMKAELTDLAPYPAQFANPSATQAAPDGAKLGATDLASPWSGAVTPSDLD